MIQTGARLVVHDPGEWPLVAEYGVDVKPDTFTLTAITQVSKYVLDIVQPIKLDVYRHTRNVIVTL